MGTFADSLNVCPNPLARAPIHTHTHTPQVRGVWCDRVGGPGAGACSHLGKGLPQRSGVRACRAACVRTSPALMIVKVSSSSERSAQAGLLVGCSAPASRRRADSTSSTRASSGGDLEGEGEAGYVSDISLMRARARVARRVALALCHGPILFGGCSRARTLLCTNGLTRNARRGMGRPGRAGLGQDVFRGERTGLRVRQLSGARPGRLPVQQAEQAPYLDARGCAAAGAGQVCAALAFSCGCAGG